MEKPKSSKVVKKQSEKNRGLSKNGKIEIKSGVIITVNRYFGMINFL